MLANIKDFFIEIQRDNIAGYSTVRQFGTNTSVPNGSWELISCTNISGAFPASGSAMRIKAGGNAADISNGAGAREITIVGIDSTLTETTETIATSGADASLLTTTVFWRIYKAYVSEVGTYGVANTDNIVIENSDETNDMLTIMAGEGQAQHGVYSIPAGKIGYLLSIHLTADANKPADFRMFVRENFTNVQTPMSANLLKLSFDGLLGHNMHQSISKDIVFNALSDIWFEARGGGASTEVSIEFEILLIDDPSGPIRQV